MVPIFSALDFAKRSPNLNLSGRVFTDRFRAIDHEIHDNLLDLGGIGFDRREVQCEIQFQLDGLGDRRPDELRLRRSIRFRLVPVAHGNGLQKFQAARRSYR